MRCGYRDDMENAMKKFMIYDQNRCQLGEIHFMAQSCLICPVSRISRYYLMIKEMVKYTNDNKENKLLWHIMNRLEKISDKINRKIQDDVDDNRLKSALHHNATSFKLR